MKVLTVYAHPNPNSFSHALLEDFTRGLADAGHEADVLDLYALKFDPVFTQADLATWLDPGMPSDILEALNPRGRVLDGARGPIQRFLARRLVSGKDNREIAQFLRDHGPKDAARHWQHVAAADALAFIAPVFWLSFPAILKGWHERVFSYGNAFALDRSGWEGHGERPGRPTQTPQGAPDDADALQPRGLRRRLGGADAARTGRLEPSISRSRTRRHPLLLPGHGGG